MKRKSNHLVFVNPRAKNSGEEFVKAVRRAQRAARREYEAEKARERGSE
jgi:hypothetical protein